MIVTNRRTGSISLKKSWAVIDRLYSLGSATAGALREAQERKRAASNDEHPRSIFCAKPRAGEYRFCRLLAVALGAMLSAMPVLAHHEILAKFDDKKPVTLKGTVTKVDWANPHVHIFMNVPAGPMTNNWAIELESTVDLGKAGWKMDTVKPGDDFKLRRDD